MKLLYRPLSHKQLVVGRFTLINKLTRCLVMGILDVWYVVACERIPTLSGFTVFSFFFYFPFFIVVCLFVCWFLWFRLHYILFLPSIFLHQLVIVRVLKFANEWKTRRLLTQTFIHLISFFRCILFFALRFFCYSSNPYLSVFYICVKVDRVYLCLHMHVGFNRDLIYIYIKCVY